MALTFIVSSDTGAQLFVFHLELPSLLTLENLEIDGYSQKIADVEFYGEDTEFDSGRITALSEDLTRALASESLPADVARYCKALVALLEFAVAGQHRMRTEAD